MAHNQLNIFVVSLLIADKRVFGVPLVLYLQRNGQTIPTAIQTAFKWLKLNALDQVSNSLAYSDSSSTFSGIILKMRIFVLQSTGWFIP